MRRGVDRESRDNRAKSRYAAKQLFYNRRGTRSQWRDAMSGGRWLVEGNYSTAQKVELALLRVLQRSVEKGWIASRPTRDCRYDLVLDDGERLLRVQVKYAGRQPCDCRGMVPLDFTKGGRRNRTYL